MLDKLNFKSVAPPKLRITLAALCLCVVPAFSVAADAAEKVEAPAAPPASYALVADLVTSASAIARVTVKSVAVLPPERAPDIGPGRVRFYVEAETDGLIRGESVMAKKTAFLLDGPADKAKRPGLKGRSFLLFGKVGTRVDQFQLTSSTAILDWTPENEAQVRKVMTDLLAANAPPAITGVSSAFHSPGAIVGEGESQIFLETASGAPISLSIIRRPDEQPQFSASLGEIVDQAASFPPPDTVLWYRLACGLPERLPSRALRELAPGDAEAANRDYLAFRRALPPCNREPRPIL